MRRKYKENNLNKVKINEALIYCLYVIVNNYEMTTAYNEINFI
jgi:hypothetical protein